jgi:hypothetical protein
VGEAGGNGERDNRLSPTLSLGFKKRNGPLLLAVRSTVISEESH